MSFPLNISAISTTRSSVVNCFKLVVVTPLISSLYSVKNVLSHTIRVPYGGYPKVCYKHVLGVKVPYP